MSLKTRYVWKSLLWCQIHLYWREIEERITLICTQKIQSESFVSWIWIGKKILIITFNHSYINTNDSDCIFCGHIRVILYSIALQYTCIWHLKKYFFQGRYENYPFSILLHLIWIWQHNKLFQIFLPVLLQ